MSSHRLLLALCSLALLLATVTGQCSKQEINNASKEFKDCVDEKEKSILHNDSHEQEFICSVLEQMKEECSRKLAKCRSREYVDDKVALHIDSISGNWRPSTIHTRYVSTKRNPGTTNCVKDAPEHVSHTESL